MVNDHLLFFELDLSVYQFKNANDAISHVI